MLSQIQNVVWNKDRVFAITSLALSLLSQIPGAKGAVSYTRCVDACQETMDHLSRSECEDWCRDICARPYVDWEKYDIRCYDRCIDNCYGLVATCKQHCVTNCRI